jgi:hypothetical protein
MLFSVPTLADSDAFVAYTKEQVEKDSPADRFEVLERTFQYTAERGYACVKYRGVANDRKARVSAFSKRTLKLEVISLYCQHPSRPEFGFAATFSHRGGPADDHFETDAAAFIDAVYPVAEGSATNKGP